MNGMGNMTREPSLPVLPEALAAFLGELDVSLAGLAERGDLLWVRCLGEECLHAFSVSINRFETQHESPAP